MARYAARRLLQLIPVFFGATFLVFVLVFALPGDPLTSLAGERATDPAVLAQLRHTYHLDDSLLEQYARYMIGIFHGDLGRTYTGQRVLDVIAQRAPVTLTLTLLAIAIETVFGVAAGVLAGLRHGRLTDRVVLAGSLVLVSIPIFVMGFGLQLVFGVRLKLLPVAFVSGNPAAYVLPATVLAALSFAYVSRLTRASIVENIRAEHVRTAVAKGLTRRRVIGAHVLRNSLIPVVTFLGYDFGALMAGAVIVEGVFNMPGIGNGLYQAINLQERPTIVGIVTGLILVFFLVNLLIDLLCGLLDPRIRHE